MKEKSARNKKIYAEYLTGLEYRKLAQERTEMGLAKKYKLHAGTLHDIIVREKAREKGVSIDKVIKMV